MNTGVIYVARGAGYADLARQSAQSLRRIAPDLPIHLFTDQTGSEDVFDQVQPIPGGCNRDKIAAMLASPFDRTLFLDCDTLVVGPVTDGFDLLDRFDMAIAHDVRRASALIQTGTLATIPACFPQHNSGVMFLRKTAGTAAFLAEWAAAYDAAGMDRDQVTLRDLLWSTDLRFWTLPPEWNLRRLTELDAWEPLDAIPRIIHSHRLLQHLRGDGPAVSSAQEALTLERAALAREWANLATRSPHRDLADPVHRFLYAWRNRTE